MTDATQRPPRLVVNDPTPAVSRVADALNLALATGADHVLLPVADILAVVEGRNQAIEDLAAMNDYDPDIVIRPNPLRDAYVGWDLATHDTTGVWTRAEAIARGIPKTVLARADEHGTSSPTHLGGHEQKVFVIGDGNSFVAREDLASYTRLRVAGVEDQASNLRQSLPAGGEQ